MGNISNVKRKLLRELDLSESEKRGLQQVHAEIKRMQMELVDVQDALTHIDERIQSVFSHLEDEEKMISDLMGIDVTSENVDNLLRDLEPIRRHHAAIEEEVAEIQEYESRLKTNAKVEDNICDIMGKHVESIKTIREVHQELIEKIEKMLSSVKN